MTRPAPLEALAAAVRAIRARECLSPADVARRGLGRHHPGQVERGRANPTHMQLDRLARGLGLRDVAELWRQAMTEAESGCSQASRDLPLSGRCAESSASIPPRDSRG